MTQQEKELLLKDLCARLPYGVEVRVVCDWFFEESEPYNTFLSINDLSALQDFVAGENTIKPYLRPMSSMTEEEYKEFKDTWEYLEHRLDVCVPSVTSYDWLNKGHFDYRGLIPMGIALEAPEGMYK